MKKVVGMLAAGLLSLGAQAADFPAGFSKCANEGGTCTVKNAPNTVAYGIKGKWVYKYVTSSTVTCNVASFGSDPYPGLDKKCSYNTSTQTGTSSTSTPSPTSKPVSTATPTPTSKPASTATPTPTSKPAITATPTSVSKPTPPNTSDVKPETIDWVWNNRIKSEALNYKNLIFDQMIAGSGKLNYCVRWESTETVTAAQRDLMATMLQRQMDHWVAWLKGYDGFPYSSVKVNVVGWAVNSRSTLQWTDTSVPVYVGDKDEGGAPKCPDTCSRMNYWNATGWDGNYSQCSGGNDKHFDMSLWGTKGFVGGAGGDWGQRVESTYLLNNVSATDLHIVEHEIGHGFNLPDFYDANQFPPTGLPPAIMQAGASTVITPWDGWMLRRVWSELKASGRWTLK